MTWFRTNALVVSAVAALSVPAGVRAQQIAPDADPVLVVTLYSRRTGGTGASTTSASGVNPKEFSLLFYATPCGAGVSSNPPELAYRVWRVNGAVINRTADGALVRVSWQRAREAGDVSSSAPVSQERFLQHDAILELDTLSLPELGGCPAATFSLQVRYALRMIVPPGTGFGDGVGNPSVQAVREALARLQAASGVKSDGRGGAFTRSSNHRRADLWLVVSAPGGESLQFHTTTGAGQPGGDFAFAPVTLVTPTGTLSVRITGTVEVGIDAKGSERLVFSAARKVTFVPSNRSPGDINQAVDSAGVAKTIGVVPGPDEVIAYQLPPLVGRGLPSVPTGFAIRLQLPRSR